MNSINSPTNRGNSRNPAETAQANGITHKAKIRTSETTRSGDIACSPKDQAYIQPTLPIMYEIEIIEWVAGEPPALESKCRLEVGAPAVADK
ncbi:MAG: hypothetical protein DKT66_06940 [Candidatus Melainabacteria bacterium]|nr:MAG: hypothetical protein DKT66_06940 [Candidatus Melainabacteria bacterium]